MENIYGLFLTFVIGLFIMFGTLIVFCTKNNEKFINFSISIAFGVMTTLVLSELLPESLELIGEKLSSAWTIVTVITLAIFGIIILKILDHFIPNHEHDHDGHGTKKEHQKNLYHIGIVSSIALVLHNIIEGMAIYGTTTNSMQLGLLVSLGVGLHNIPMGMVIASTFYNTNKNMRKTIIISFIISISTFLGGIIMFLFSTTLVNDLTLGILFAITLGMLIYIVIFELLPQIYHTKNKSLTFLGIILGVLILLVSVVLE